MGQASYSGFFRNESAVNTAMIRLALGVSAVFPDAEWQITTDDLPYQYQAEQGYGSSYRNPSRSDFRGTPFVDSVWDVVWVIIGLAGCIEVLFRANLDGETVFEFRWVEGGFEIEFPEQHSELHAFAQRFIEDVSPENMPEITYIDGPEMDPSWG